MTPEELDAAFWEELGITPIILDTSSDETIEAGMQQLSQAIIDAAAEIQEIENNG